MAITLVQWRDNVSSSPASLAYSSNNTAGNMLIVWLSSSRTVSDTAGNTWSGLLTGGGGNNGNWYCAPNCKAGPNTINLSGAANLAIFEFTELDSFDVGGTGFSTTPRSTWSGNSITTTHATELIIGHFIQNSGGVSNPAINSPFTGLSPSEGGAFAQTYLWYYETVSSIQTGLQASGTSFSTPGATYTWSLFSFYKGASAPTLRLLGATGCGT